MTRNLEQEITDKQAEHQALISKMMLLIDARTVLQRRAATAPYLRKRLLEQRIRRASIDLRDLDSRCNNLTSEINRLQRELGAMR